MAKEGKHHMTKAKSLSDNAKKTTWGLAAMLRDLFAVQVPAAISAVRIVLQEDNFDFEKQDN